MHHSATFTHPCNRAPLQDKTDAIAALDGVIGCGLVEIEAGMTWCAAGREDVTRMTEAATDFWRLTLRHSRTFEPLGPLRVQMMIHRQARVTSVACPLDLLLVCVTSEPDRMDWVQWKSRIAELHAALRAA